MKHHLWIIIAIVLGFSTFMMGYSLPPFLEVGFGGGEQAGPAAEPDADVMKQYQDMYKEAFE
jgi:hypothetical protein